MLRLSPGLSHASSSLPPIVLMRCTVVTFESMPLPRRETTSSLSQSMSFAVAPPGGDLAGHRAAVGQLPGRAGIMAADNLVVRNQRRDRLPESPGQLAIIAGLAFVDLRALRMHGEHDCFSRRRNGVGKRCLGGACA